MNKISNKTLLNKLEGLRIDVSNLTQELIDEKNAWREHFNDIDELRLRELRSIEGRLDRLHTRILKNQ